MIGNLISKKYSPLITKFLLNIDKKIYQIENVKSNFGKIKIICIELV
jgi:hypothetical protein